MALPAEFPTVRPNRPETMSQDLRRHPVEVVIPDYGVFALESRHSADFRMRPSRHDFLEVFYVFEGRGRFLLDGCGYPCRRDDLIVVPPGTLHVIEDDQQSALSLYGVCVAPSVWRHDPRLSENLPVGRLPGGRIPRSEIKSDLRALLFEQTLVKPWSSSVILGITLKLLGTLLRANGMPEEPAAIHVRAEATSAADSREMMRIYIHDLNRRFFEHTDLEYAALRLGMSRRRFTQLFREETGMSWLEYVQRLRIDYACQLLEATPRTIESVAFECGYDAISSFYRVFKRQTGLTPAAWRQARRDKLGACPI